MVSGPRTRKRVGWVSIEAVVLHLSEADHAPQNIYFGCSKRKGCVKKGERYLCGITNDEISVGHLSGEESVWEI